MELGLRVIVIRFLIILRYVFFFFGIVVLFFLISFISGRFSYRYWIYIIIEREREFFFLSFSWKKFKERISVGLFCVIGLFFIIVGRG